MSKVMQVYGMTVNEVSRLTNGQVAFLLEQAERAAMSLLKTNNEFQQSLGDKLSAVKAAVRASLEDRPSLSVSAPSSNVSAPSSNTSTTKEGNPIGRPPAI